MDFTILTRAGVTQGQFAELVGVSRPTVNTWVKGRWSPGPRHKHRAEKALRLIAEAIERGVLPAPTAIAADRLAARLRETVYLRTNPSLRK
jgi:transcriptional regulator with XRE-family HTH domain